MDRKETYQKRLAGVYSYMDAHQLDGAMFTSYENRRYYCGFTGSNGCLIITRDKVCLVTDKRYTTQAQQQTIGVEVIEHAANRLSLVADTIKKCGIKKMVMESCMTVDEYFPLKEKMGDIDVVFEQEYFLEQRMVKDAEEIACTKAAIAAAEAGFDKLLSRLKTGMTEKDLADELHYLVSKEGAEAMSFGTIVGSGARGALAHAFPTSKKIEDLAKDVEDAHRAVFLRENLDDYALRGLGHGIGLQIHECPRIVIGNETVLKPGMIFTVEPGLYFPNDCGVRTEDDVLVTENGVENLSHTPHEIHIG